MLSPFPLRDLNTFGFAVDARYGVLVSTEMELRTALTDERLRGLPRLVLGGGSNLVLTRDFDGLALGIRIKGRRLLDSTDESFLVEAGAGENWHEFVAWTLAQGYPGLENLALIPGTVGASPVQNIGAYGLELSDRFHSLRAMQVESGDIVTFDAAACRFAYRDSVFKREARDRYIITSVTFALPKIWCAAVGYADLRQVFSEKGIAAPRPEDIFDAVVAVRQHKLPDPKVVGNAGSFFKNPVVDADKHTALLAQAPGLVAYPQPDGQMKLAAGWLIDRCGWKGRSLGAAAVHERQALVLINPGQASGQDVMTLAHAIMADVHARFGVTLEIEPLVL